MLRDRDKDAFFVHTNSINDLGQILTNRSLITTAATILEASIADEPWVGVGYGKRPKHGRFFNQYFRPKWRRNLEYSLLKEIVCINTAAYLLAGVVRQTDLDMVIEIYVDGADGSTGDLFRTFGFLSRTEALSYFGDAIREYHEAGPSEWASILARRIGVTHLPDHDLSWRLRVGSVRFTMNVEKFVVPWLRNKEKK